MLVVGFGLWWLVYAYFLWRWGRYVPQEGPTELPPLRVAVLVPVRNEEQHITACLESLLHQTRLPDEIWVLDDHSQDGTAQKVAALLEREERLRYRRLPPDQQGKKAALALGLASTQADIILTTDGDTRHEPDTVEKMLRPFRWSEVQVVGGWVRLQPSRGWLATLQRLEVAGLLQLTAGSWQRAEPLTANGALLAYRRSAFYAVGGWGKATQHPSGDDDLLVHRIRRHYGPKALFFSHAVVETFPVSTWRAWLDQRLRWLSKRRLYVVPWPWIGMGLLGGTQGSLLLAVAVLPPWAALVGWIWVQAWQYWLIKRGLAAVRAPHPSLLEALGVALLYPVLAVAVSVLALLHPGFKWKGRSFR
ncbi:MAG: glycosyltransferase [Bacteroidetes bacterium]|nr:MAG: glycosyltransferase [Bacteroidota bacterium]